MLIDIFADEHGTVDLSAGDVVGITFTITLLVGLPVGMVTGLVVAWWVWRRGRGPTSEVPQQKTEQLQGVIYKEPVEPDIPLSDNLAYIWPC